MTDRHITGTLRSARKLKPGEDPRAPCLRGQIYGDSAGRFRDGAIVTTSTIMRECPEDIFETRNSVYRVETWAQD